VTNFVGSRNPGLDMLRALSALAVFLYHFRLVEQGWLGVQVFFVISGYVITQSIESRPGVARSRILSFYGRRIRRILPPLYIYLLLVAPYIFLRYPVWIKGWIAALTFTTNFYHLTPGFAHSRLLTHTWSLGVEEQFYLVFPFLMVLWRRHATAALILVVLAEPLVRWQFAHLLMRSDEDRSIEEEQRADREGVELRETRDIDGVRSWGDGMREGALWMPFLSGGQEVWGYSLVALLAGLLVVRVSRLEEGGAVLRWLAFLGFYSYEFYLLHYPVREFSLRVFPETALGNIAAAVVCFPIIVLLSVGLHRLGLQVVALLRRQPRADPAR
jgi:peptidoglycan/LPS O-acetylase OafA/YrhL